ncbi:hypothetical protein DMJ13_20340 [halophilic archaeon]|nr:hypothetical protein DMJ13_20340 [halophilic archaeon]
MTAVTAGELPAKLLHSPNPGTEKGDILDRILAGGTTIKDTRPPLPAGDHLVYNGKVYQLSHEVVQRTPATRYSVKVDIVEGDVNASEMIQFSELPRVDRRVFAANGLANGETVGIGTTFLYTDAERAQSALVPESKYSVIVWEDGSKAEWVVDDAMQTTVNTYRYSSEKIATAATYGQQIRKRAAFTLSNLPDAQRKIVTTTISDSEYVIAADKSLSSAFAGLVRRFRDHDHPTALNESGEGDLNGVYLLEFDDTFYWTVLMVQSDKLQTTAQSE